MLYQISIVCVQKHHLTSSASHKRGCGNTDEARLISNTDETKLISSTDEARLISSTDETRRSR